MFRRFLPFLSRSIAWLVMLAAVSIADIQSTGAQALKAPPLTRPVFDPSKPMRVTVGWPILDEEARVWTDRSGEKFTAILGGRSPKTAIFYTTEGKRYERDLETLSEADHHYFLNKTAKRVNRTAVVALGKFEKVRFADSFSIRTIEGKQEVVRLAGIDAPDRQQQFGAEAVKWLERLKGRDIRVEFHERDKHKRLIGDVYLADRWLNYEMVLAGHAWHDHRTNVDERLSGAQEYAKQKKRGFWAFPNPISPWDFRGNSSKSQ